MYMIYVINNKCKDYARRKHQKATDSICTVHTHTCGHTGHRPNNINVYNLLRIVHYFKMKLLQVHEQSTEQPPPAAAHTIQTN